MYYYIIDLGNKQIAKMKEKIEMMMASFGISGDFGKISPLSSAYDLAKRAISQNYSTIVAIGDNEIINQVAQALANSEAAMGIVPINAEETICDLIGTNGIKQALEILRTRKIQTIDLGKVTESKYFLTRAIIKNNKPISTVLDFGRFKIGGDFQEIIISNGTKTNKSFRDGLFEIKIDKERQSKSFWNFFKKPTFSSSVFYQESVKIETEKPSELKIGKETVAKTPTEITLLPFALKLIVTRIQPQTKNS